MTGLTIDLTPVASSNLAAVGYDADAQMLSVQFQNGHVFNYRDVPTNVWEAMDAAPSKGSFYAREIRGRYKGEKITGKCPKCGDLGVIGVTCTDCGTSKYYGEAKDADSTEGA